MNIRPRRFSGYFYGQTKLTYSECVYFILLPVPFIQLYLHLNVLGASLLSEGLLPANYKNKMWLRGRSCAKNEWAIDS